MSIEILTVSLSDESVERIAQRVAQIMGGGQAVTESNPLAPEPQAARSEPVSAPQADPWTGQQAPAGRPTPQQGYPQQPPVQQPQGGAPVCAHGPMRHVPAGFSKTSGKAYAAFWGCSAQRNDPNKCKSVPA